MVNTSPMFKQYFGEDPNKEQKYEKGLLKVASNVGHK